VCQVCKSHYGGGEQNLVLVQHTNSFQEKWSGNDMARWKFALVGHEAVSLYKRPKVAGESSDVSLEIVAMREAGALGFGARSALAGIC
jgi:hypothetical protein